MAAFGEYHSSSMCCCSCWLQRLQKLSTKSLMNEGSIKPICNIWGNAQILNSWFRIESSMCRSVCACKVRAFCYRRRMFLPHIRTTPPRIAGRLCIIIMLAWTLSVFPCLCQGCRSDSWQASLGSPCAVYFNHASFPRRCRCT